MLKKGQISLFIILGLVLLIIVVTISYLFPKSQAGAETEKTYNDIIRAAPVKQYVNLCLDRSVKDGLRLAGLQGGIMYNFQVPGAPKPYAPPLMDYGLLSLPFKAEETWYTVPMLLYTTSQASLSCPLLRGNYPYVDLKHSATPTARNISLTSNPEVFVPASLTGLGDSPCTANDYQYLNYENPFGFSGGQGWFGSYKPLIPLCDKKGINYPNFTALPNSCESYSSGQVQFPRSTQQYLERYIQNHTYECLNLSLFSGYNITLGIPVVNLTIGDNDVSVHLNLPVTVNISDNPVTTSLYFYNRKDVRLKLIHELAMKIIQNNTMNIFFIPELDASSLDDCRRINGSNYCLRDGMQVTRYANVCYNNAAPDPVCTPHGKYADIINITDTKSDIDGHPYSFIFGVENRRPALEFIHDFTKVGDQIPNTLGDTYDLVVFQGDMINITPYAFDPDHDLYSYPGNPECKYLQSTGKTKDCMNTIYHYSGWKADYEQEFYYDPLSGNITGLWLTEDYVPADVGDPQKYVQLPMQFDPDNPDTATNPNIIYRFLKNMGLAADMDFTCLYNPPYYLEPRACTLTNRNNKWETSSEYSTVTEEGYQRIANYLANRTDVGPHLVNVSVWDEEGLVDYQTIRLLVYKVKGPGYPGLPSAPLSPVIKNNYASIEDPYTLKLENPPPYTDLTADTTFTWVDKTEGAPFPLTGESPDALLKLPETYQNYNITRPFSQYMFSVIPTSPAHKHVVNLTIENPSHSPSWDLYVYECLPYHVSVAPYPYNQFAADAAGYNTGVADYATDHSCCRGSGTYPPTPDDPIWGTIRSSGACYTYSADTCGPPLPIAAYDIPPANLALVDAGSVLAKHSPVYPTCIGSCSEKNAVYSRIYSQSCGNRGNACSGTVVTDKWFIKLNCNSKSGTEDESCTGVFDKKSDYNTCLADVRDGTRISVTIPDSCINYESGHSWEKDVLGTGNGICNKRWKCTDNSYGDGNSTSTERCQAQCDGNGACTKAANCQYCSKGCKVNPGGDDSCKT